MVNFLQASTFNWSCIPLNIFTFGASRTYVECEMLFMAPPAERRGSQSIAVRLADKSGADMSKPANPFGPIPCFFLRVII